MSKPTAERVRELLNYDPETGVFTWMVCTSNRVKVGDVAGGINNEGYIQIKIDGKSYLAHRLAWLYMMGYPPVDQIDHRNNIRTDNRWSNLRAATQSENLQNVGKKSNNTSGFKGVSWSKNTGKWRAEIRFNRKSFHLGFFDDPELAALSHAGAARLLFGDFSHSITINVTINYYSAIKH